MINKRTPSRCFVALCILLAQIECLATDYHVDATGGNDDYSGLDPSHAWKTVTKVNASSFVAGDRILFRRGQVWRESLIASSSGEAGRPITYGAYGVGDRPMLKGSALVQGWTGAGRGSVWKAPLNVRPDQVFFNGVRGILENTVQNLDQPLEWCWSSGSLYVCTASDPNGLFSSPGIEASVRPSARTYGLLHIQNREYVTVESLAATQSYSFGIYIKPASRYITVSDCEVSHSLDGGIVVPNAGGAAVSQVTLLHCLVHHNNGGYKEGAPGVATYHEGVTMEAIDGFTIRGCRIYRNYMEGLNVKRGGRNGVIEDCTLYANDIINIYQEGASNIEIRYNRIYDCTYNAGIEFGLETDTCDNDNIRIHHNLFRGNGGGVSFWAAGGVTAQTHNVSICNNTFVNNGEAIRWKSGATDHYSGVNTIVNNLFWQKDAWNVAIRDYTTGRQGIGRTSIDHNAFQQNAASDTLGAHALIVTNPCLIGASASDFHLRAGSPCIDAGTNVGLLRDLDGNTIPQGDAPDVGAYEYVPASPAHTPTAGDRPRIEND